MKPYILWALLGLGFCRAVWGAEPPAMDAAQKEQIRQIVKEAIREYAASLSEKHAELSHAKGIVNNLVQDNRQFVRRNGPAHFKPFLDSQHPRATVITCSDSRVHTHALDATPDGDLFMVRNIGNQISTAEGSVEYGVHHLHTPLLLIVGHVACGAIKAAAGDYSQESPTIQRELDTIQIPKGESGLSSVKLNVHNQVRQAMAKFEAEVMSGELTVMGAVYDFRNEMRQGQGKLNIINVNGETDPGRIAKLAVMQGVNAAPQRPAAHARPLPPPRRPLPPLIREKAGQSETIDTVEEHAEKPAKKAAEH